MAKRNDLRRYSQFRRVGEQLGTGNALVLPRQQFQLLYREVGWNDALRIGIREGFILWHRDDLQDMEDWKPYLNTLHGWAFEVDQGREDINPAVEAQFKKRWANYPKALALRHVAVNTDLVATYAQTAKRLLKDASEGKPNPELQAFVKEMTPILQHANTGASFMFREHQGASRVKEPANVTNIGNVRVVSNRPTKKIKAAIPAKYLPVIEAEVREVG